MTEENRHHYYRNAFNSICNWKRGISFQDFFEKMMRMLYPDFRAIIPKGRQGDWKCDGICRSIRTYYQVYAPWTPNDTKTIDKIKSDFEGILKKHGSRIKEWVFVYSDFRVSAAIENLVSDLETTHGIKTGLWDNDTLWDLMQELDEARMAELLYVPIFAIPTLPEELVPDQYVEAVKVIKEIASILQDLGLDKLRVVLEGYFGGSSRFEVEMDTLSRLDETGTQQYFASFNIEHIYEVCTYMYLTGPTNIAERCYRALLDKDPNHTGGLNDFGTLLLKERQLEEALKLLQQALNNEPENKVISNNLGLAMKQNGAFSEAEVLFQKAVSGETPFLGAFVNLSTLLRRSKKIEDALGIAEQGLERFPDSSDVMTEIGRTLYELDDFEGAIDRLKAALESDTWLDTPGWTHYNLGLAYIGSKLYVKARDEIRIALGFEPDVAEYLNNLGIVCIRLGLRDEAEEVLKQAHKLEPEEENVNLNLGILLMTGGKAHRALSHLQRAFETGKDDEKYRIVLAACFAMLNRMGEMRQLLGIDPRGLPDDTFVLNAMLFGILYDGKVPPMDGAGESTDQWNECWDQIVPIAEKSIELQPENDNMRLFLVRDCIKKQDFQTALTLVERGLEIDPGIRMLRVYRPVLLVRLGRHDEAYPFLYSLVNEFPDDSLIKGYYGSVLISRGEKSRAREFLTKAVVESLEDECLEDDFRQLEADALSNHERRATAILAKETPVPMDDSPKIVMRITPVTGVLITSLQSVELAASSKKFDPPGWGTPEAIRNSDGIVVFQESSGRIQSYTQVYLDGRLEIVYSKSMKNGLIDCRELVINITEGLHRLVNSLKDSGAKPPMWLCFSLVGAKGFTFASDRNPQKPRTEVPKYVFHEDIVTYPHIITLDERVTSVLGLLIPAIKYLWRLANFDDAFMEFHGLDTRFWTWDS